MCVFRHPNFIILPERNKIYHTKPRDRHAEFSTNFTMSENNRLFFDRINVIWCLKYFFFKF